jgi:hypothetical protein
MQTEQRTHAQDGAELWVYQRTSSSPHWPRRRRDMLSTLARARAPVTCFRARGRLCRVQTPDERIVVV